jgi:hypothetical protein
MISFKPRAFRVLALFAALALINVLVLPVFGQVVEEPEVTVIATDDSAHEEGPTTATFTFARTGDLTEALTINYTVSGTATNGTDYVALTGTATIAAGNSTTAVTVTPIDDDLVEGTETVIVTIDASADYTIGTANQATAFIIDNDEETVLPEVTVIATDDSAHEEGPTTATFTFARTGDLTEALTINYTVSGTATNGTDYVALTGTATIAAGNSTTAVTVTPIDDDLVEGTETVIVTIDASADYTIGTANQATAFIIDNDEETVLPEVTVIATDDSAHEEGPTTATFTFARTGDLTEALTINYTVSGTATNGTDYVALTGTATIAAGNSTTAVTVTPIDDDLVEGTETVIVTIDASADYTIGTANQATAFIIDNDEETVERPRSDEFAECKDGGWVEFGIFHNQGDCVAFHASDGRNVPGLHDQAGEKSQGQAHGKAEMNAKDENDNKGKGKGKGRS